MPLQFVTHETGANQTQLQNSHLKLCSQFAQWERVQLALKHLRIASKFPFDPSPVGTTTITAQPMPGIIIRS